MKYLDIIDVTFPEWHARAICHPANGHDPEIWFPITPNGSGFANRRRQATAQARRLCAGCDVKATCLQAAIDEGEAWGVRGGVDFGAAKKEDAA